MTTPLVYSLEEAPRRLGGIFTKDFLKGHLDEIPHIRLGKGRGRGGRVGFTDEQLAEIVRMFTVKPEPKAPAVAARPVTRRRAS